MTAGPGENWASEMQALQDQIEQLQLELECARRNEAAATYWQGQDDGVRGAAIRWAEALTAEMPKAGVMQEPLESLYRRTEVLRHDLACAIGDIALLRGQRDGYVFVISDVIDAIGRHWEPHNKRSRAAHEALLVMLGEVNKAGWASIKATWVKP